MRSKLALSLAGLVALVAALLALSPRGDSPPVQRPAQAVDVASPPTRSDAAPGSAGEPSAVAVDNGDPSAQTEAREVETRDVETRDEKMARLFAEEPALLDVLDDAINDPDTRVQQEAEEFLADLELEGSPSP